MPFRICQSGATRSEQAIDLRLALRSALQPSVVSGRILDVSARGRGSRRGPRRPSTAGTGLLPAVSRLLLQGCAMTRPSPPPSVPSHSLRLAGMSSCGAGEPLPRHSLPGPGRLSPGNGQPRADSDSPRGGAALRASRSGHLPYGVSPGSGWPGAMPSWARSPRAAPSATKGCGLPRRLRIPRA